MEKTVDFAAIARVAKRAELKSVRLVAMTAKCEPAVAGALVPTVDLDCKPGLLENSTLEVICEYAFTAHANNIEAVSSKITYVLEYEISGAESPSHDDLVEFARANGALNSWPFSRELLFSMTSRMGYPPYTLPLMHFSAKPSAPAASTDDASDDEVIEPAE